MEITANQILGLPVFSLARGEKIGQVRNYLLDAEAKEIIALTVGSKKFLREGAVLCLADATGISPEAVTVDSPAVLRKKSDCPHLKNILKDPIEINGLSVIKKTGEYVGKAVSFYIDSETGKITRVALAVPFTCFLKEQHSLDIAGIRVIGHDMILAEDHAEIIITKKKDGHREERRRCRREETEAGCGEKIMALSERRFLPHRRFTVFPDIPGEEREKES